jgi:hypothetical protein
MTEPTDVGSTDTAEPTEDHPIPDPTPSEEQPEPSPNSEAARWRTKLRETETQLGALTERLTGYQRRECESAVADLLEEPGDLWDIGQADVSAFYSDDGTLDEDELRAAAGALADQRPRLAKPQGPRHLNFGQYAPPPPAPKIGWETVIGG